MAKKSPQHAHILTNVADRLDELNVMLHNVWYLVRLCADLGGEQPAAVIKVNAEALSTAMVFCADEISAARASVDSVHHLVEQLRQRR